MWYRYYITVPRTTDPVVTTRKEIGLPEGVITKVRVRYPPGSRGRVHTAVFQGVHKMWPRGEGNWAWGDDEPIEMGEHVRNITGWHWFLEGYPRDTSYDHVVWWDFNVLETEYAEPYRILQELVDSMKELFGL
ncbi:hypothetical protein ES707_18163 [subsurface metagenome]